MTERAGLKGKVARERERERCLRGKLLESASEVIGSLLSSARKKEESEERRT